MAADASLTGDLFSSLHLLVNETDDLVQGHAEGGLLGRRVLKSASSMAEIDVTVSTVTSARTASKGFQAPHMCGGTGFRFAHLNPAPLAAASRICPAQPVVQNDLVMWLANVTPTPTPSPLLIFGVEQAAWPTIIGIGAALAALFSAWVAFIGQRRTDRREHHRWLLEKRREAYVTFMTAARGAYDAISERGQKVGAPRVESDFSGDGWPDPEDTEADIEKKLAEARADIDKKIGEVERAQDILAIVGPEEMETLGLRVIARLKLDRGYYSPEGFTNRNKVKDKERILLNAEATGNTAFLSELRSAYAEGTVNTDAFREAFHKHRLEDFWNAFNLEARTVLRESKPGRHL